MTVRAPAAVGMRLEEVDTPALILELDAFESNLKRLADAVAGRVRVRAHAKTHKCPEIARRQVAAGAVGVCCQKVSEAEAMVDGGIADVLVSNEVVGGGKLERLAGQAGGGAGARGRGRAQPALRGNPRLPWPRAAHKVG